jgi:hypothetical protein
MHPHPSYLSHHTSTFDRFLSTPHLPRHRFDCDRLTVLHIVGVTFYEVSLEKQEVIVKATVPYETVLEKISKTGKEVRKTTGVDLETPLLLF